MAKDQMENKIREVAKQLFLKQGFAATSTTQIAREVGCTQALVHYYYRTKENLFRQIFIEQIQAAVRVVAQSLTPDMPFEQFLSNAISLYIDTLIKEPRLPFFVMEELIKNQERRKYLCEQFLHDPQFIVYYMQLEAIVKREQQAGRMVVIDTIDIAMSVASLTVFMFIAMPLMKDMLNKTDEQMNELIYHRKAEITRLILQGLRP